MRFLVLALVVAASGHNPPAQPPRDSSTWALQVQQPPRDTRPPAQQAGTGEIRGRVLAGDTGTPLRRVMVALSGAPLRPPGPASGVTLTVGRGSSGGRNVLTDETGSFTFTGLPAGSYRLGANPGPTRPQYLGVSFGARAPMEPGEELDLADGQRLEGVELVLPRAAVVTGRVTDDAGDPLARVMVYLLQSRGGRLNRNGPTVSTDDLGQYRLFGIAPGDYVVAADSRMGGMMGPPVEGETIGFVTTYSPGTANPSEALRLRLRTGQEAVADIRMLQGRLFRVSGSIVNARGEPVQRASIQLMRRDPFGQVSGSGASVDRQGRFSASNVAPGEYRILARSMPEGSSPAMQRNGAEMAIETVLVDQADVSDVLLVVRPGASVTGTIVFDTPVDSAVRVRVMTASPDQYGGMTGESSTEATGESFTLENLFGEKLIRASAGSSGWALKEVLLRGRDITDVPTAFTSQDSGRLRVVLTSRAPSLEGTVAGDDGQPVKGGGVVVIFGEDPATWIARSSMMRVAGIMPDGTYRMQGLREGQYYVVAVPRERAPNAMEPSSGVFEALGKEATRVTLGADEHRRVDLTLSPSEPR